MELQQEDEEEYLHIKRKWQLNSRLSSVPLPNSCTPRGLWGPSLLVHAEIPSSELMPSSSAPALTPSSAPTSPLQLRSQSLSIFRCCCSSTCLKLKKSSAKCFGVWFFSCCCFLLIAFLHHNNISSWCTPRMINKTSARSDNSFQSLDLF